MGSAVKGIAGAILTFTFTHEAKARGTGGYTGSQPSHSLQPGASGTARGRGTAETENTKRNAAARRRGVWRVCLCAPGPEMAFGVRSLIGYRT